MADMTDTIHRPAKGDQYRNKETIPGYGPGLLIIQIIDVWSTKATKEPARVSYLVIESNRMRTGPFVGVTGEYSADYLNANFEYMPETDPSEGELELEPTA